MSAIVRRDTTINGRTYSLLLPPVRSAMPLCTEVATLLGPLVGSLGANVAKGGWGVLASALNNIDSTKIDKLLMKAVVESKLCCEGQPVCDPLEFERHFGQHRSDVFQAQLWCLWECVKDFFPQLGAFAQVAKKAAAEAGSQFLKGGPSTTGLGDLFGRDFVPGPNSATEP